MIFKQHHKAEKFIISRYMKIKDLIIHFGPSKIQKNIMELEKFIKDLQSIK